MENKEVKWFDDEGFIEYIKEKFPWIKNCDFTCKLLKNIVADLMEQIDDNEYLAYTISKIVPSVTIEEVSKFCAK